MSQLAVLRQEGRKQRVIPGCYGLLRSRKVSA
jgi:hypothetical protein